QVVLPALPVPRGEPRVRALFAQYLSWISGRQGGCLFMALSHEYDDRPGPVRNLLVKSQQDWVGTVARAAQIAIEEKHFRADLDVQQFAFEWMGIGMSFQEAARLFEDPKAHKRAQVAFEALLSRARRGRH
ncbi:MAG TPA: TetR/AcrR family transcriptional regulator, partial [Myxococcaceae bacterium]|nr:TetR/AcrR family transcriptional regulator [Myxococcaceae bacterium]